MKISKKVNFMTLLFILVSCASPEKKSISDPVIKETLSNYEKQLQNYRSFNSKILSPNLFNETINKYKKAKDQAYEGKDLAIIQKTLNEGRKNFKLIDKNIQLAYIHMKAVLDARKQALDEGAIGSTLFSEADRALISLSEELEERDINDVLENRDNVTNLYVRAEVQAIRERELETAQNFVKEATKLESHEYFENELKKANTDIKAAKKLISKYKDDPTKYLFSVSKATNSSNRLYTLVKTAQWIDESNIREITYKIDKDLNEILKPLDYKGSELMTYNEKVNFAKYESQNIPLLIDELSESQYESYLQTLKVHKLKKENTKISKKLKRNKKLDKKIAKIRKIFKESEAKIYLNQDDLIIRLVGLNFKFDDATLPKNSNEILNKVAKSAKELNYPKIEIVGHADSKGNAKYNKNLSTNRALNVNKYLVNKTKIEQKHTNIKGAGYQNPISENKSKTGRKTNRRVDIVFNSVLNSNKS